MVPHLRVERTIYLDYAATTPCDPRVVASMAPYWTELFANPSSTHRLGRRVAKAVETTRATVLQSLSDGHGELAFTSGATESNNLAVASLTSTVRHKLRRTKVLYLATEHKSVLEPLAWWARFFELETEPLRVTRTGQLDMEAFQEALTEDVGGVIAQLANSETGVIQSLRQITNMAHDCGALVFSDITQAVGRIPVNLRDLGVEWAAFSSHKIYGPKGIGGLYARTGALLEPILRGGGQERGRRAGTENVPAIIGFGVAVDLSLEELPKEGRRLEALRDALWAQLQPVGGLVWNSYGAPLLPSHLNLTIGGVAAQDLMLRTTRVALSAGSACNAQSTQPSAVLLSMKLTPDEAERTIRLTVGRPTTDREVTAAATELGRSIRAIRADVL